MSINQSSGQLGSDLKESGEKIGKDLSQIKDDAIYAKNKVFKKTEELSKDIAQQWNGQVEALQVRFDELTDNAKGRIKSMDHNLHKSPYWYLAGAAALGFGLGLYKRQNGIKKKEIC